MYESNASPPGRRHRPIGGRITVRPRYAGRCFSAASALGLSGLLAHPERILTVMAAALRRPRRVVALIVVLLRTRSEYVLVSRSVTGEALRQYLDERAFGVFPKNRLCRGVLVLPQDRSDYLRGRRRQALRTNLRRAATAGISCEVMDDRSSAVEAVSAIILRQRRAPRTDVDMNDLRSHLARPELTLLVARDERGRPLAFEAAVIDEMACLIVSTAASSHEARWALHNHLVDLLIARGVRYVLATGGGPFGALGFETNVQHYQHLLGYELRHLTPVPAHPTTRKRRRLAALVAAATTAASLFVPPAAARATPIRAPPSANAAEPDTTSRRSEPQLGREFPVTIGLPARVRRARAWAGKNQRS
jgi:hypothetical protein